MNKYENFCPEIMGGLPTPRVGSERLGDKVITKDGRDVTEQYKKGAEEARNTRVHFSSAPALLRELYPLSRLR